MLLPLVLVAIFASLITADCPPGSYYESYFNKCYQFIPTPKSFLDAEQYCNSLGGHLAEESNAFENSFISTIARGTNSQAPNFWIGANLLRSTTNWSWTSNTSMSYTSWAIGQPDNSNSCAFVRNSDSNWVTYPCGNPLSFMCTISPNATVADSCPTVSPPPTCESSGCPPDAICTDGYTLYPGSCMCYKYYNDTKSFADASTACNKAGGMLAKIPSKDVNDFLAVLPGFDCWKYGESCPYFGLVCSGANNSDCKWTDGTSLGSFTNFYMNYSGAHYFVSTATTDTEEPDANGKWFNQTDERAYLCQKDATTVTKAVEKARLEKMKNRSMNPMPPKKIDHSNEAPQQPQHP